jgi:hypothetical protein
VNLLHPPYTLWHLSYVVIGISLAPIVYPPRSIATIVAFLLGLGIGAHALDETMGNPLQTKLSKANLYLIGFSSLAIAVGIGVYYSFTLSFLLLPIVFAETFFAICYNLEMFGKKLHASWVFSLSWGMIPLISGYFVNSLSITLPIILISIAAGMLTYIQRVLSTSARFVRRKLWQNGNLSSVQLESSKELLVSSERVLKILNVSIVLLAIALALGRVVT